MPRHRLSTYGHRAFSVATGPTVWSSLPEELRDPKCSADNLVSTVGLVYPVAQDILVFAVCPAHYRLFYENALYNELVTFDI